MNVNRVLKQKEKLEAAYQTGYQEGYNKGVTNALVNFVNITLGTLKSEYGWTDAQLEELTEKLVGKNTNSKKDENQISIFDNEEDQGDNNEQTE